VDTQPAAVAPVGTEPPAAGPRLLHIPLATFSAILAAVLAVASYFGPAAMIGAVAIVQAVLVVTWVFGTALPGRIGALILGVSASGAGDFVATRYHSDGYAPLLGVLGVGIPLMFVHQLTRGVVRTRVVESLADITVLVVACVATTGFILLRYQSNGDRTTLAVASAVGIALSWAISPMPSPRCFASIRWWIGDCRRSFSGCWPRRRQPCWFYEA